MTTAYEVWMREKSIGFVWLRSGVETTKRTQLTSFRHLRYTLRTAKRHDAIAARPLRLGFIQAGVGTW